MTAFWGKGGYKSFKMTTPGVKRGCSRHYLISELISSPGGRIMTYLFFYEIWHQNGSAIYIRTAIKLAAPAAPWLPQLPQALPNPLINRKVLTSYKHFLNALLFSECQRSEGIASFGSFHGFWRVNHPRCDSRTILLMISIINSIFCFGCQVKLF